MWRSSFTVSITYLSTQEVPNPCKTTHPSGNTEISCPPPSTPLKPGGVLIIWTESGFPYPAGTSALDHAPGKLTTIAGHAARVYIGRAGLQCGSTGATRSVRAVIASNPRPSNETFQMTACLSPANQPANTRAVLAMFNSLHIIR